MNFYAYAGNNPVSRKDPSGLKTCVIVFYKDKTFTGIGEHTAVRIDNGGVPVLYDPGGDYRAQSEGNQHPSDDRLLGRDADLARYIRSDLHSGQGVEILCFDTTAQEEAAIAKRFEDLGGRAPLTCASSATKAINNIGPFKDVGWYLYPSSLAKKLRKLKAAPQR